MCLRSWKVIFISGFLFLLFAAHLIPAVAQSGHSITEVDDDDGGAVDTIGAVGQRVVIRGGGFGTTQGSSTVTFNGTAVTSVEAWTASYIITSVPSGATTGNLLVTVGGVASNAGTYTLLARTNLVLIQAAAGRAPDNTRAARQIGATHGGG